MFSNLYVIVMDFDYILDTAKPFNDYEAMNGIDSYIFQEDYTKSRVKNRLEATLEARRLVRKY